MFVYYRRGYEWSPQDRKAAEILAAHAAIAMRIKRFHRNIEDSFEIYRLE